MLSGDKIMQKNYEKNDLGKILSCVRLARCNESIADMAETLGISPTYLNSIECDIRPCTYKILEAIFVNYLELKEIKTLNLDVLSQQNVFNSAWNAGLHSTLGIPLSASEVFRFLQKRVKKQKSAIEKEKSDWLQKIYENPMEFNSIPSKLFLDAQFIEDIEQAVRFSLMQKFHTEELAVSDSQKTIDETFATATKKATKSIAKCGKSIENAKDFASKLEIVKIKNKSNKCF